MGLFGGNNKKKEEVEKEKERVTKMVIDETTKQIEDLQGKLNDIPNPEHRQQVQRYLNKLAEKKRRLETGTFYK